MSWDQVKEKIYWLESSTAPSLDEEPPGRTEVLVVGGGYTGLTAALRLGQAGREVTVLDERPMGTGASSRNGGMVLPGLSQDLFKVVGRHGDSAAGRLLQETNRSVTVVENLVAEGGIDCGFRRTGYLTVAFKPSHVAWLKAKAELLRDRFGENVRLLSAEETRSELGSDQYHGALFNPAGAGFHPARYMAGLIGLAQRAGVKLCDNISVDRIERVGRGFSVTAGGKSVQADRVIMATNGYTGGLVPWLRRRVIAVRSLMVATEPLPAEVMDRILPNDRMVSDTKIFLYYFRRSPDGQRILFGGRPQSPSLSLNQNGRFMWQNMLGVYPQLRDFRIDYVWWGRLGFTLDRLPHLGQHDGLYYAMGYCGHGAAMATHFGERLADMVLERHGASEFARIKFKAIPVYDGRPWFLPLAYKYFSLKDRLS
jgi:glycine/D-amino acid oxidase-like deaminating enzyme